MRNIRLLALVATVMAASAARAQTPAADPSDRLRQVLPADVAARVLATIAAARAHDLPAAALENRALKFAARGVPAADIEASVDQQAARMEEARSAIARGRGSAASGDEVEAGAEAMRKGVDGAQVSDLARSAPSGRSLAVPLYVIGSLVDRGIGADDALKRVRARLAARASDRDLEDMPNAFGQSHKPTLTGQDLAATKRPSTAGAGRPATAGPPAGIPGNGGKPANPGSQGRGRKP